MVAVEQDTLTEPVEDEKFDATRIIARNAVLGMIIAGAITFAVCIITVQSVGVSLGVASMPALFAGPFVAGLLTVINYHTFEERHGGAH